ncbi:MAG: arginase family protein [Candidatus Aenigmatarchaeota archaeon]
MDFALLGICYDKTQTLRKGAAKAPKLIRKIFPKLETYLSGVDLSEAFVEDLGNISPKNIKDLMKKTFEKLNTKKFPIIIGGEHTITLATVKKLKPKTIVVLDAHPDCENKNDHSGIVRKLIEDGYRVILYGVRTFSKKEEEFIRKNRIKMASLKYLKNIKGPIYLSIDFDVLDPSIIPSVGNPEPNGLSFEQVLKVIRILSKKLIAVDFVEFTPTKNDIYTLMAGKLIYFTLAEILKVRK